MSLTGRRAATLPELVIALLLLGLLGTVVTRALLQQARATRAAIELAEINRSLEQASVWLGAELGDIGRTGSGSDLYHVAPESLSYRATRSTGLTCLVARDEIRLLPHASTSWRAPQPGRDSILVLLGPDTASGAIGQWVALPLSGVTGSSCWGRPAIRLGTVLPIPPGSPDSTTLHPVRTFEVMQAKLYRSQGRWWLGARSESAGEVVQPVAGPLVPGGLRLTYSDSLGRPVFAAGEVRQIEVRLVAGAGRLESTRVVFRPRSLQ